MSAPARGALSRYFALAGRVAWVSTTTVGLGSSTSSDACWCP